MTRTWNDPDTFVDDVPDGPVRAHPDHVVAVPGGIVRSPRKRPGRATPVEAVGAAMTNADGR